MAIPKIVIDARPVTTVIMSDAVTTPSRPRSVCSSTGSAAIDGAVSACSTDTVRDTGVDAVDPDAAPSDTNAKTDTREIDAITPQETGTFSAQLDDAVTPDHMDRETLTSQDTRAIPDLAKTCTDNMTGDTAFMDAIAHLDACTGNVPLGKVQNELEELFATVEFNTEKSPDVIEI